MASLRMRLMVGDLVLKVGRVMMVIVRVQEISLLELRLYREWVV